MDFQKGWDFVFKDQDWWKKCLIAAGLLLTGIGGIAVYGWMMAIIRTASSDDENAVLPDWHDIGTYFVDGLKAFGLYLVWSLPFIILIFIFVAVIMFATMTLPEEQGVFFSFIIFPFQMLMMVFMLPITFLGMVAITLLANGHGFDYALDPRNSWKFFKADFGNYIIAMALYMFGGYLFNMAGMLLCFIGMYFTTALSYALFSHFLGQAYKSAKAKLDAVESV